MPKEETDPFGLLAHLRFGWTGVGARGGLNTTGHLRLLRQEPKRVRIIKPVWAPILCASMGLGWVDGLGESFGLLVTGDGGAFGANGDHPCLVSVLDVLSWHAWHSS